MWYAGCWTYTTSMTVHSPHSPSYPDLNIYGWYMICCMCVCDLWSMCVFTEELMKLWKVCVAWLTVGDEALRLCLGHWWPGWCSEDRNTSAWSALMTLAGTVTQPGTRWRLNLDFQIYVDSVDLSIRLNYKYCSKGAITAKSQGATGNSAVGVGKSGSLLDGK